MFMIPMPPTSRDCGYAGEQCRHDPIGGFSRFGNFAQIANREVIVLKRPKTVTLAQQGCDLLLGRIGRAGTRRGNYAFLDIENTALEFFLDCRKRHYDGVVLIPTPGIEPLLIQNTQHAKRQIADPNGLSDWIASTEQLIDHGLAQHGHTGCSLDVTFVKETSLNHLPVTKRR